jgi:hypothetical protein
MATPEEQRILLALDACCDASAATIETAVHLADRLGAALEALFVEDVELLRAAELPFVSEVVAGGERVLTPETLRQTNRRLSAQAERLMADAARLRNVRWQWRTAEGSRALLAATEAVQYDLFMPGRPARPRSGDVAARASVARVAVVHGGPAQAARALAILEALTANGHTREVLLVGESRPPAELLDSLAARGVRVYVQATPLADPAAMIGEIQRHAPGLLVAPRTLLLPAGATMRGRLFDALPMALLMLR